MKKFIANNRILAAVLAAALMLASLGACTNAKASIVQRKVETNRGTGFHSTF